jgi:hypothetical protein
MAELRERRRRRARLYSVSQKLEALDVLARAGLRLLSDTSKAGGCSGDAADKGAYEVARTLVDVLSGVIEDAKTELERTDTECDY